MVIVLCILLCGYLFMIAPSYRYARTLKSYRQYLYAHRGLHDTQCPENTMEAFERAVNQGYGIELDVRLTKDHVVVVFHDEDLLRACEDERNIIDLTYQELQSIPIFKSQQTIPTLQEVLTYINDQVPLIIEIKEDTSEVIVAKAVAPLLDAYQGRFMVESFNPYSVAWFKKERPHYIRGQLAEIMKPSASLSRSNAFFITHLLSNVITRPHFIAYNIDQDSSFSVLVLRNLQCPFVYWTIRSEAALHKAKHAMVIFEDLDEAVLEQY